MTFPFPNITNNDFCMYKQASYLARGLISQFQGIIRITERDYGSKKLPFFNNFPGCRGHFAKTKSFFPHLNLGL